MSYASNKGYSAEHAIAAYLAESLGPLASDVRRPRTTSLRATDTGDIAGLPLVISAKNHARDTLSTWVDELSTMVERSPYETGVVWHKRVRAGQPSGWYVTTNGRFLIPLLVGFIRSHHFDSNESVTAHACESDDGRP